MLQKIKNLFIKRSIYDQSWLPYRQPDYSLSSIGNRRLTSLAVVSLAIRLYTDGIIRFPLKIKNKLGKSVDHYLLDLLQTPNSFQSREVFFSQLVSNIFLSGNQHVKIKFSRETGKIKALLPFVSGAVWAYPRYSKRANDFSDPIGLEQGGYYYRDYRGRTFFPYEILHLKDLVNSSDLLNGISRISLARIAFSAGIETQEAIKGISESGMIPPVLFNYSKSASKQNKKAVVEKLEQFFHSGQTRRRRALFLPDQLEAKPLQSFDMRSVDLSFIKKSTDLDMAKLFNIQCINNSESMVQSGAKEAYRALTNIALKPFLIHIANSFSSQLLTERERSNGLRFVYETQVLSSQDFREQSTFLTALKKAGIISVNESRELIGLAPVAGMDGLKETEIQKEILKEDINSEQVS